jgi:hypothetical protein
MNKESHNISLGRDKAKEKAYLEALEEFNSNNQDKGLFTKLFVELNGDEKRVKIAYLEIRAREIFAAGQKVQANAAAELPKSEGETLTAIEIASANERMIKYQRLEFCTKLMVLWIFLLFGLLFFNSNFPEVFEGDHPLFGLIFGLSFLIPFVMSLNAIWYLANEAGKLGSLWAISSWVFFPIGFVISYYRIKKIAAEQGWVS